VARGRILRYISTMTDAPPPWDEEFEAFLREEGLDPDLVRAEQARMAQFKRTPEEEAKLAAERAELREASEAYSEYYARNGSLSDHVRAHTRSRS